MLSVHNYINHSRYRASYWHLVQSVPKKLVLMTAVISGGCVITRTCGINCKTILLLPSRFVYPEPWVLFAGNSLDTHDQQCLWRYYDSEEILISAFQNSLSITWPTMRRKSSWCSINYPAIACYQLLIPRRIRTRLLTFGHSIMPSTLFSPSCLQSAMEISLPIAPLEGCSWSSTP